MTSFGMLRRSVVLTALLAAPAVVVGAEPVTFNKDIAPLIYQHCVSCHRPGEVAPFPLLSYRDVQKRGRQILTVTADRYMPPWKPVAGHGDFVGARQLTEEELTLLERWVAGGTIEGNPADLPPLPQFTPGWQLGKPDLVVTMPQAYQVPPEGPDIYRNFVIPVKIPKGKYIRAAEYRPSNPLVVHHAGLAYDVTGRARKRDAKDPKPGFTQFTIPGLIFPGTMSAWTPGRDPVPLPDGISMPWPAKGADLILQLHLHPSGKPEIEQSSIGLYFTDQPPRRSMVDIMMIDKKIDIPPGEKAYRTRDALTLPVDMAAFGIFPHMHLLGKEIRVTAVLPDGSKQSLLWIDDWDFKWQNYYQYRTPVKLPKGTRVEVEWLHDNSAGNLSNPSQPPRRVSWGEQTTDEMSALVIQFIPARETDLLTLFEPLRGRIIGGIPAGHLGSLIDMIRQKRPQGAG